MKATGFQGVVVIVTAVGLPPIEVTGWSDADDAFMAERSTESMTYKVGVKGDMAVFLSSDRSGKFTLKLFQTSPTNKKLLAALMLQEGGPTTFAPVSVTFMDTYRQDKILGLQGILVKVPPVARGKEVKEHVWEIVVQNMLPFFGDPDFLQFATAAAEAQG